MNKKQIAITLGIMCFILTFAIAVQIKTMNSANSAVSQSLVDDGLRDDVLRWKERYDSISEQLKQSEKSLEEVRDRATQNDTTATAKQEELKKNNTLLGLTNVKGSGIVIEVQDGKADNSILYVEERLVHFEDILSLVNELRNSGAEAIEINGQRVVDSSAITCEGAIIKINGERIGSPFTIKAIGSQALLYGSMTRMGSYLDIMKTNGVDVKEVRQEDDIVIKKYNGPITYKYMKELVQK